MRGKRFECTADTLAELKRLRDDLEMTKREACDYIGISLNALNRAADRAGLREQLSAMFPKSTGNTHQPHMESHIGMRWLRVEDIRAPLLVDLQLPHIQAAIQPWRVPA